MACALTQAPAGAEGRILHVRRLVPVRARALQSYGILGGARFQLRLRYPALVIHVEGVEVALDAQVASDIYVLLMSPGSIPPRDAPLTHGPPGDQAPCAEGAIGKDGP